VSEPIDPELLLEPVPMDEPLPADPAELPPVVPGELVLPLPVVPPLVEPVWAKAAPAASIETTANRFHHVFRMRKNSR
jgi:hypothetical protein